MGYVLDGVDIPRPKKFKRDFVEISEDFTSVDGKSEKDLRARKEKFTLSWEMMATSDVSSILTILDKNTAVTFSVSDSNLTIDETDVFVSLSSLEYGIPGDTYYASLTLELLEEQ